MPPGSTCSNQMLVCSITRLHTKEPKSDVIEEIFPVAGELREKGGKDLDAKWERTKNQGSHSESEVEGVRVTLNGGFKMENDKKTPQKAIIEFICDKTKTGLENLPNPEDPYTEDRKRDEPEKEGDDKKPSLEFVKYKEEDDVGVLRLKWTTQYACEESKKEQEKQKGEHWGFFTWFIIMYARPFPVLEAKLLTFLLQRISLNRNLPHFRLMAQLQPIRRPGMGSSTAR